jgi:hypothetical protein
MAADFKRARSTRTSSSPTRTGIHIMGFPMFTPIFVPGTSCASAVPVSYEDDTLESIIAPSSPTGIGRSASPSSPPPSSTTSSRRPS